jgi:hypothetical protein
MDWGKVVSTISGAAPLLGSLFGPAGTAIGSLAGGAIKLVASALGVEPTQDAITTAIATDPAAAEKLKEFEMTNKLELQKLSVQQLGMELADVQSARQMNMEGVKATGKRDINLYVLMWLIVFGFFLTLIVMQIFPANTNPNAALLFGTLAAAFGAVIQYNFGSNRSSDTKTDMIYNSTPNVPKKEV